MNPNSATRAAPRRQYRLADLLTFFVAASVYLGMLASLKPLFDERGLDGRSQMTCLVLIVVSVLTAWCVLWAVYRAWKLRQALWVHLAGPIAFPGLVLCVGILGGLFELGHVDADDIGHFLVILLGSVLYGCGVSSLVSLPMAAWMLLALGMRPVRPTH